MPADQRSPDTPTGVAPRAGGDLGLRTVSGVVMALLAIGAAWAGGIPFVLFWAAAALLILREWLKLAWVSPAHVGWIAAGLVYAGAAFGAPVVLRSDPDDGLRAIVFLFAVVWSTDIFGYVCGRAIGGPKLWPAVSPKKTQAGAAGSLAGAVVAGVIFAKINALPALPLAALAAVLSVASQAGDLAESAFKRHFGAKDASHIIPGHGGVMDRLDGFIVAALVAAIVGLARGGVAHPSHGLLAW